MLQKVAIVGGFSLPPQAQVFEISPSLQLSLARTDVSAKMIMFSNLAATKLQTGFSVVIRHSSGFYGNSAAELNSSWVVKKFENCT